MVQVARHKVRYLSEPSGTSIEQSLEHLTPPRWVLHLLIQLHPDPLGPLVGQRTVLGQVVVVIESLLLRHHVSQDLPQHVLQRPPDPTESERLIEHVVDVRLLRLKLLIQDMLDEESVLSVGVGAVEQSVSVDDVVPVALGLVVQVGVARVLQVVLV